MTRTFWDLNTTIIFTHPTSESWSKYRTNLRMNFPDISISNTNRIYIYFCKSSKSFIDFLFSLVLCNRMIVSNVGSGDYSIRKIGLHVHQHLELSHNFLMSWFMKLKIKRKTFKSVLQPLILSYKQYFNLGNW